MSLIYSLKNCPKGWIMTDEGDISNYLGLNIRNNSDGTFEILQPHFIEKIISHIDIIFSARLKHK